ncbi:amidohydrolase family protein [Microbacterium hydrocarbonoxydans]|uniref:amidohydrolase family protein n=1 Tax=Microbacterium hydrocarbonoxydans TaxID=273678 RepID=UPI0007BC439D|nr:amidohydrolase family protein [Microbacterium hydrocarbonoxydans]GAT72306.1 N-isopropylammelide isopropyl amidohydrolase AtzC [Microbacterium sp. HM58-2]
MAALIEPTPLVAAGLVDAHIHPDKTSWGDRWMARRPARTLDELIENNILALTEYGRSVEDRAYALLSHALRNGTLAMRAHVDVGTEVGLAHVEGVRAAAERIGPDLTVQIVCFPQFGLLTNPGTLDLMAASLDAGADIVGGIDPLGRDGDVARHLDAVFGLSVRSGRDLDIHLHDGGEEGLAQIREIAERTRAAGMQGRVAVSHAFALCDASLPSLRETLDAVAEARLWITTCALGPDPVPDLDLFESHGVQLAAGSDGVRDSWSPFGTGSMVDRAHLLGYRTGAVTDADLERCYRIASREGGRMLGIPDLDVEVDATSATRLEFDSPSIAQLVVDRPAPARVIRHGRVL